jgi:hypothetical protein
MATGQQPLEQSVTAEDVDRAERRVAAARERAALAGLSAARSFEESARRHERVAKVQDVTAAQGASHPEVHRKSAIRHRQAAADDRKLAQRLRKESELDLFPDADWW